MIASPMSPGGWRMEKGESAEIMGCTGLTLRWDQEGGGCQKEEACNASYLPGRKLGV